MKTYIWSLPTRLFHWLLVLAIITAYILGEEEELLNIHTSIGYFAGTLILFRILWGIVGPKYSRFRDFHVAPSAIQGFLKNITKHKDQYPGHNPAASLIMLLILSDVLLIVFSGVLLLSSQGEGFFSFISLNADPDALKELHEAFVTFLIILIASHLAGILLDFVTNRKMQTLQSIFTGYKNVQGEGIRLKPFQVIIAILGIAAAIAVIPYTIANQKLSLQETGKEQADDQRELEENDD
jgi:cytochrome b